MSLSQEQAAFLLDACKLIQYATEQGFMVTGGELARTPEQQALHVKAGRSKTMNSTHLKRCAIDLNFFKDGQIIWDKSILAPLGAYWET
jgi:peptidoglycan L-alanyl-D-glutamate endopeptidase CwlK